MSRESSRGLYTNSHILEDPMFIACLEDSMTGKDVYDQFIKWINGSTVRELAESYHCCRATVQGHLQRTKAIYNIFADREIPQRFEDEDLRRNIMTRAALLEAVPDVNRRTLTLATATFNRYWDGCRQLPELLMALATDECINNMPRVGDKLKELYFKAREYHAKKYIVDSPGGLEMMQDLIDLRNLFLLSRPEMDFAPVDRSMGMLMDHGIFSEEKFYTDGWKVLVWLKSRCPWDIRRAYAKALKRRHPDVKDPIVVLVIQNKSEEGNTIRVYQRGAEEKSMKDIVARFKCDGWQTGVGGKMPGMPVRIIQIR